MFNKQSGSWKLGGFDLTYEFKSKEEPPFYYWFEHNIDVIDSDKQKLLPSEYCSPERVKSNYSLISDCVVWSQDMYSFGQQVFLQISIQIDGLCIFWSKDPRAIIQLRS